MKGSIPYRTLILTGIVLAAILGIYNIYVFFFNSVSTQVVTYGEIENSVNCDGYVVRNEDVLVEDSGMLVNSLVSDGERVSRGSKVAVMYSTDVDPAVQAKLKDLTERTVNLERLRKKNSMLVSSKETGDGIANDRTVADIITQSHAGKGKELYGIKLEMEQLIDEHIAANADDVVSILDDLKKQKKETEDSISGVKTDILAKNAGLYFSSLDGYEGMITPDEMGNLMPSDLKKLDSVTPKTSAANAYAKVADSYEWYFACTVPEKSITVLKNGSNIGIRFNENSDKVYDANVKNISNAENGNVVLIVSVNEYCEYAYYNRKINADIIISRNNGLKVFKDAIKVVNSKSGVYVVNESVAKFRPVKILATDDKYAVISENNQDSSSVRLYDEVVVKGNVTENELVK